MLTTAFRCTVPQTDLEQDLAEVDRHIAEAEKRIARQSAFMDRLARDGQDTAEAHAVLNDVGGSGRHVRAPEDVGAQVVVGHSWGTLVALAWALQAPQEIAGLVLASGYYYPSTRLDEHW